MLLSPTDPQPTQQANSHPTGWKFVTHISACGRFTQPTDRHLGCVNLTHLQPNQLDGANHPISLFVGGLHNPHRQRPGLWKPPHLLCSHTHRQPTDKPPNSDQSSHFRDGVSIPYHPKGIIFSVSGLVFQSQRWRDQQSVSQSSSSFAPAVLCKMVGLKMDSKMESIRDLLK